MDAFVSHLEVNRQPPRFARSSHAQLKPGGLVARAVREHPHVHVGEHAQQAHRQRFLQPAQATARPRLAHQDVGGASVACDPRGDRGDVVDRSRRTVPRQARRPDAAAARAVRARRPTARIPGRARPGCRDRRRGAGRSATHAARRVGASVERHQRQQPLRDRGRGRPNRRSSRSYSVSRTRRFASTSSATCRSATSRSACRFSTLKNPPSAAGTRSGLYTRPSRRREIKASGVRSSSTSSSARVTPRRESSRARGHRLAPPPGR